MPAYLHYGNNKSSVDNKLAQSCWSLVTEKKIQTVTKRILWGGSSFHQNIGSGVATTHHHYHGHCHCHPYHYHHHYHHRYQHRHRHRHHPIIIVIIITELKQRRRRRLRKRHLQSKLALLQTLPRLFHFVYFVKCWQIFLELNSKGLYQSLRKKKESCCLVFPSSTKRAIRHFYVVVVQRRQRNVQKSVMRVESCCFANLNLYCVIGVLFDVAVVVA